ENCALDYAVLACKQLQTIEIRRVSCQWLWDQWFTRMLRNNEKSLQVVRAQVDWFYKRAVIESLACCKELREIDCLPSNGELRELLGSLPHLERVGIANVDVFPLDPLTKDSTVKLNSLDVRVSAP